MFSLGCKCHKYPYDIDEYIRRMLQHSHKYMDLYEKYIWLETRYEYLRSTGKEIPHEFIDDDIFSKYLQSENK